ncbi:AAA family ATPase [Ruania halotolerans]|uniref:AAA family ATPase n=1 Tax=Ruania halotolerans TaxID=2897773 RepID=UPI001E441D54|nr:AAA family ATPase [Ruania halotolerans]UFU04884.1 AAA family ATPase [Ruania halotolerans]
MGRKNYLVEGPSGAGKTTVCDELQRRGLHAVHGDRELAYRGDPETGEPTITGGHEHHIWDLDKVRRLVSATDEPVTFFCGGSRNFQKFIHLFDEVFVLDVDLATLDERLRVRPEGEWGARSAERERVLQMHRTGGDVPEGVRIDATAPVEVVVDEILRRCRAQSPGRAELGEWTADFWLDPACPLTRHTARWISLIAAEYPLRIRWRVMSLSVLNEHRGDDPEGDPDGYLWIPARVATAVLVEHGHDALGRFYDALWTEPDGTGREWIGDISEALHRSALPRGLAEAGTSTAYDSALRASHHDGVDRIDAEIGTPVLVITTAAGERRAMFGPVLGAVPARQEAIRLWEATLLMTSIPAFREITC